MSLLPKRENVSTEMQRSANLERGRIVAIHTCGIYLTGHHPEELMMTVWGQLLGDPKQFVWTVGDFGRPDDQRIVHPEPDAPFETVVIVMIIELGQTSAESYHVQMPKIVQGILQSLFSRMNVPPRAKSARSAIFQGEQDY